MDILEKELNILNNYEKHKVAIYKWRNLNKDKYNLKMHEYNKKHYEKNREDIIKNVRVYQKRKQIESGQVLRRVGRPSKYSEIETVLDN
jgi:hypothetical protein